MKVALIGFKEADRTLHALGLAMNKMGSHNLKQIAEIMLQDVKSHFKDQGRDIGGWAELAEITKKRKKKYGQGIGRTKKLYFKSPFRLYNSWESKGYSNSAIVQTNDPVASFHEHGTPKMPARPMMYLSIRAVNKIFLLPYTQINEALRK